MKAIVQRVSSASVTVDGEVVGKVGAGLLVLLGVVVDDDRANAVAMAKKLAALRIFEDDDGKMNRSVVDIGGELLLVSQFTLAADTRKGNRPSFVAAARPEQAEPLYEDVVAELRSRGLTVATGRFRTHMDVSLVNSGPVTIALET